jgi:hypothetical protein
MIPENLNRLHGGEEALRAETLRRISETPNLVMHLGMVERTMDLIYHLLDGADPNDCDGIAVRMLGIRVFNGLAVTLKLLLSGYYQASALQLRDVLETVFLLDFFQSDRSLIAQWRNLPDKERRRKFAPAAVRKSLDKRDQFTSGKRDAAYDLFCRLAAHPNPDGATMLIPVKGSTDMHCGPFLEFEGMKAVLQESVVCAVQAGICLRRLLKSRTLDQLRAAVEFFETYNEWFQRIYNVAPDVENVAASRRMLNELEQRLAAGRGEQRKPT